MSDDYGLTVSGASATIQLVSPLTKEQVSLDNGGGGNWGAERGAESGEDGSGSDDEEGVDISIKSKRFETVDHQFN
jgi:hypothetical protein